MKRFLILLLTVPLLASCGEDPLFERLDAGDTGIHFSNRISSGEDFNIINYTNIYNGGGVAVADFNGDSLQDLFFTGNEVANRLYLNRGDFRFEEVTDRAGVAGEDRWSSGVAAADINGDGLTDLYVCATTYEEPERKTNRLYINRGADRPGGVPKFKEMAEAYGLADTTNTTMAAFFDYDNDRDLDLFLLVNKITRNSSMDSYHEKMTMGESVTTDRLYRNDGVGPDGHPTFTDVSDEAGILIEGFGLGVNIADINKDGWKDIYVANDFVTNEVVYMNNGDGTFTDRAGELFKHTVHASMGVDIADINNDAYPDVLMLDMRPETNLRQKTMLQPNDYRAYINNERYGYDYQYVRNQLQVYQGDHPVTGLPLFSDIGMIAGISETDWSWTPSLADFDNDGLRDLLITNGFPQDITDHDFADYITEYFTYLSLDKILQRIPRVKLGNYAYRNRGDFEFEEVTESWGLGTPSFSNGAVYADLDRDGDLDYVVNNISDSAFVYRNRTADRNREENHYLRLKFEGEYLNTGGIGAGVQIEYGEGLTQYYEHSLYRGYLSTVEPAAHFGLGSHATVNKLTVTWPGGDRQVIREVASNQVLTLKESEAAPLEGGEVTLPSKETDSLLVRDVTGERDIDYTPREYDYNDYNLHHTLQHKLSQYGPGLAVGDVNGDGLDDLYVTGAFEYPGAFLLQREDGTFSRRENLLQGVDPEYREEETGALFFDADGDGDQDLYIASGSYELEFGDEAYQDRLFINEGGRMELAEGALPNLFRASSSAVRAADFDRDGDLDLFVGGRVKPHEYPKPVDSYLLENVSDGDGVHFENVNREKAPALRQIGLVSDALWTDYNGDGWVDLILAGEWMPIRFLKNVEGRLVDETPASGIADSKGWWNSLCGGDFDNDGDTDYIAGNLGLNTHFHASIKYPMRVYGKDFDGNGTYDPIPTIYKENVDGEMMEVPYHMKQDIGKQINSVHQMFESYRAYADAPVDELLARLDTTGMMVKEATFLKNAYLENRSNGLFSLKPLPSKAQWAPVYGCRSEDLDQDGNLDVLLAGNDYGLEISNGRLDAYYGLILGGDGQGSFEPASFEETGYFLPGDAKSLVALRGAGGGTLIAAGQNRGPLKLFRVQGEQRQIALEPSDAYATITYSDGSRRKREFYYGSTFLSASGRFLPVNDRVTAVEFTSFRGETRSVKIP